jgi:photosystem II stability/assembly factor-like uncharacterized protein
MKNLVLVLCFFLFTTYNNFSQSGWQLICSFSDYVSAICFIDTQTGFAGTGLTGTGKMMKTTDAGNTWNDVLMSDHFITKIYFYNHTLGFAIGDYGTLFKTIDSGNNWILIPTGETEIFRGIFFLNEQIGWICVGSDKILRTANGGNSWDSSFTTGAVANIDVEFINEFTGYAVGVYANMYKSIDSGIIWNQITEPMAASMFDIEFINEDTGFIVGGTGVAKTVDGGSSWNIVKNSGGSQINSIQTFGDKFVWAVGSHKIYYSSDNGTNWMSQAYTPYSYLLQISCVDSVNVWVLGGHKLYRTSSGGVTGIYNQNSNLVGSFILHQNYPNPFNPSTSIQYAVSRRQFVSLKVYDLLGREVATLVNEEKPAGEYEVEFDGTELPNGIYFYQLRAGQYVKTKKMVVLK